MKHVDDTLRRLDEEIVQHRKEIAGHQVAIMRLEDTRRVLMGLVEGDQLAAEEARAERVAAPGQINGHAQPMLIVRRTGTGDDEPPPKKAKKRNYEREREMAKARLEGRDPASRGKRQYTTAEAYGGGKVLKEKVVELVKKTGPILSREIGNRLNMPTGLEKRQPLSNALYELKKQGVLQRDDNKLYSLAHSGMQ